MLQSSTLRTSGLASSRTTFVYVKVRPRVWHENRSRGQGDFFQARLAVGQGKPVDGAIARFMPVRGPGLQSARACYECGS